MLWSLRTLQSSSKPDPSRPPNILDLPNESKPLPALADAPSKTPAIRLINPELEEGFLTPQPWSCRCVYQQPDFCPYCDHEQSIQLATSISVASSALETSITNPADAHLYASNSASRRRKLRKLRPQASNQQLHYEILNVEAVLSARPDSVLSIDSRTPLLNTNLPSNPNYLPLPPSRRTPNKLEKRDKRKRSISMSDSSYLALDSRSSHSLHRKIVRSKSFLTQKTAEKLGPRPEPISSSIGTDALVSLAWTGEVTSPVKVSELLLECPDGSDSPSHGVYHPSSVLALDDGVEPSVYSQSPTASSSSTKRRSVLRKQKDSPTQNLSPTRSWTLAMVITDDGITDEKLVDDLENMRIKEPLSEPTLADSYPLGFGLSPLSVYQTQLCETYAEYPPEAGEISQEDPLPPSDSSWNSARQVLLLCRELVRTERRYLLSLKTLITNGTNTPPPPLMLPYLPGLIAASEQLLEIMESNPSVQGVSEALLNCEAGLKEAFVNWCSVVGQFFHPDDGSKVKPEPEELPDTPPSGKLSRPRSRATSLRTHSAESGLSVVIPEPNKIRRNTKARPSVRDLAILPTQRIMRYVLLFKELHSLTPTTLPFFAIVKNALQAAESIAKMANEAQGHSAFRQFPIKSPIPPVGCK